MHGLRERVFYSRYKSVYSISEVLNSNEVLNANERSIARGPIKILQNQLQNNYRECLPKSKRNLGRPASFSENVIELGSQFHKLVPDSISTWSKETLRSHDYIVKIELPHREGLQEALLYSIPQYYCNAHI